MNNNVDDLSTGTNGAVAATLRAEMGAAKMKPKELANRRRDQRTSAVPLPELRAGDHPSDDGCPRRRARVHRTGDLRARLAGPAIAAALSGRTRSTAPAGRHRGAPTRRSAHPPSVPHRLSRRTASPALPLFRWSTCAPQRTPHSRPDPSHFRPLLVDSDGGIRALLPGEVWFSIPGCRPHTIPAAWCRFQRNAG